MLSQDTRNANEILYKITIIIFVILYKISFAQSVHAASPMKSTGSLP